MGVNTNPKYIYKRWVDFVREQIGRKDTVRERAKHVGYYHVDLDKNFEFDECINDYLKILDTSGLSYKNCTIAIMYYVYEYDAKDVAMFLDSTPDAVYQRLMVIRDGLRSVSY